MSELQCVVFLTVISDSVSLSDGAGQQILPSGFNRD